MSDDLLKQLNVAKSNEIEEGLHVINSQAKSVVSFLDSYHRLTHLPNPVKQHVEVELLFKKLKRLLPVESNSDLIVFGSSEKSSIYADPNLVLLVLINLIRNALQSIEGMHGGFVRIEAFETEREQCIKVVDNGPGIPKDLLSSVFIPFFSTKKEGSGIGLSLSQRIMQLHGGKLTVSSDPNVCTVFTLLFPFR